MLTKTRRVTAATAVAAAALTGIAACGTSSTSASSDPKGAVSGGIDKLDNGDSLTATFKIDMSAADLEAFAKRDPEGGTLTMSQATALAGGSLVFASKTGGGSFKDAAKNADAQKKASFAFTVNAGDDPKLVEIRYVNQDLFARADVKHAASYGGNDISQLESFVAMPSFAFLKPAVEGQWVKLPFQDILSFAKSASGSAQTSVSPNQINGLQSALSNVFTKDVTVAKGTTGGDLGDQYLLTGSSRTIATDLIQAFKSQLASVPGASKAFEDADPTKVPDKQVKIEAFVKDGELHAVKLDISQFASGKDLAQFDGKPFYFEVDFADSADISAPANATALNLGEIIGAFSRLGDESSGSSDDSGDTTSPTA